MKKSYKMVRIIKVLDDKVNTLTCQLSVATLLKRPTC